MLHWPDKPRMLMPHNDVLESDSGYHVNPQNCPNSPLAWFTEEFREPFDGYNDDSERPNNHQINIMIGILEGYYSKLAAVARKYPDKYTPYDAYNGAWICAGYQVIKETKNAEKLARSVFGRQLDNAA